MKLEIMIQLAGLFHLGLLAAGGLMPRVVGFGEHLPKLPVFLQQLFRVYYAFVGGIVLSPLLIVLGYVVFGLLGGGP